MLVSYRQMQAEVGQFLKQQGVDYKFYQLDQTDAQLTGEVVERIKEQNGIPRVIINNSVSVKVANFQLSELNF